MTFSASPDERIYQRPQGSGRAARIRVAVVLAICLLVHAIPVVWLARRGVSDAVAPDEKEIPVEVMVEPPPEPERPQEPQKEEPQKQEPPKPDKKLTLDEKEATDAPRARNEEKLATESRDAATVAPKVAPEVAPPPPPPDRTVAAKPDLAPAQQPLEQRPDGDPVKPETPKEASEARPTTQTQVKAEPDPVAAALAARPYAEFAPPSEKNEAYAGNSPSTYLSVVYGKVLSRLRQSQGRAKTQGKINFVIDYSGRLMGQRVLKSSGSPQLDADAMAAIRAAAPFPPSPIGIELSLELIYAK
jgi:protein TonB